MSFAICSAPTIGRGDAGVRPPPSAVQVASGANRVSSACSSRASTAATNRLRSADPGRFRRLEPLVVVAHALARAVDDLPAGRFGLAEERRDVAVAGVEDVVQQECRPLVRREPFEQDEEGDRQIGGEIDVAIGGR